MPTALLEAPQDLLSLPAGDALGFVDAATGEAVANGLSCSLVLRRGGRLLGRAQATPSGLHHWPELAERWRDPAPAAPVFADVLVRDRKSVV